VHERNPHISELSERIDVVTRAVRFGKHFHVGRPEVRMGLDRNVVLQLILHHLELKGMKETKKVLEKEARVKAPTVPEITESRLVHYLIHAMKQTEKVYDLAIADKAKNETSVPTSGTGTAGISKKELELEEHLYSLSLLEDDVQEEDADVWEEPEENIIIDKTKA